VFSRRWNRTDRRYRPCSPVDGTEPTVDIPTGQFISGLVSIITCVLGPFLTIVGPMVLFCFFAGYIQKLSKTWDGGRISVLRPRKGDTQYAIRSAICRRIGQYALPSFVNTLYPSGGITVLNVLTRCESVTTARELVLKQKSVAKKNILPALPL